MFLYRHSIIILQLIFGAKYKIVFDCCRDSQRQVPSLGKRSDVVLPPPSSSL